MNEIKEKRRHFTGKLITFDSKEDRAFNKKALSCYLKGDRIFSFGKDIKGNKKWYNTLEEWK